MNRVVTSVLAVILGQISFVAFSFICPDPQTSSLQWGVPPSPWKVNPLSVNRPQGEVGTLFIQANILVAGYGQGVTCTYRNSVGYYSIWWQALTKIPAPGDYRWIANATGGYVCAQGITECEFSVIPHTKR